jgi:hypothetical protein
MNMGIKPAMPRLFSYVVEHDRGHAPNPYFRVCSLCRCKFRKRPGRPSNVVELAETGDWVVGTGGANLKRSAGHGKIVYAMQVTDKLTRQQYFLASRYRKKKPIENGSYEQQMGDNKCPVGSFKRNEQFVLISRHFFYFGRNAIDIEKKKFPDLEKSGPGFRSDFDPAYIARFVKWLKKETPGRHGDPQMQANVVSKQKGQDKCKPSC